MSFQGEESLRESTELNPVEKVSDLFSGGDGMFLLGNNRLLRVEPDPAMVIPLNMEQYPGVYKDKAMRRLWTLLTASALLFTAAPSPAAAISASEVARGVESKYSSLRDLSADFRQESRIVTLGRSRIKSGTIRFERPGRMRWDYHPPDPQLVVSDGSTLWFYRPGQQQVIVQDISAAFTNQTPLLFLFGEGSLAQEFDWDEKDLEGDGDGIYTLAMRPREETPDLISLTLEVRALDFSIGATVLEDAFGNVTRLEFSEEKENQGLPDEIFTFQVPEGTEVIRP